MTSNRVTITGIGCVSSLGWSVETTWRALISPGPISPQRTAALDEDHLLNHLPKRKDIHRMDRRARLALAAALEAFAVSGLKFDQPSFRRGICVGVGVSDLGIDSMIRAIQRAGLSSNATEDELAKALTKSLSPRWLLPQLPNMTAAHLAIAFRAQGPVHTSSDAMMGGQALQVAASLILDDEADVVLAGEVDASLHVRELATGAHTCTEGAGFLVFESEAHARARGAKILAYLETLPFAAEGWEGRRGESLHGKRLGDLGAASGAIDAVLAVRKLREGQHEALSAYRGLRFIREERQ